MRIKITGCRIAIQFLAHLYDIDITILVIIGYVGVGGDIVVRTESHIYCAGVKLSGGIVPFEAFIHTGFE